MVIVSLTVVSLMGPYLEPRGVHRRVCPSEGDGRDPADSVVGAGQGETELRSSFGVRITGCERGYEFTELVSIGTPDSACKRAKHLPRQHGSLALAQRQTADRTVPPGRLRTSVRCRPEPSSMERSWPSMSTEGRAFSFTDPDRSVAGSPQPKSARPADVLVSFTHYRIPRISYPFQRQEVRCS